MSEHFDAYHRWLGIPPKHQPADWYRLLGLERFEADLEVIVDAAERQIAARFDQRRRRFAGAGRHLDVLILGRFAAIIAAATSRNAIGCYAARTVSEDRCRPDRRSHADSHSNRAATACRASSDTGLAGASAGVETAGHGGSHGSEHSGRE